MGLRHFVVSAAFLSATLSARADLLGDQINVTYAYPTSTTVFQNSGN